MKNIKEKIKKFLRFLIKETPAIALIGLLVGVVVWYVRDRVLDGDQWNYKQHQIEKQNLQEKEEKIQREKDLIKDIEENNRLLREKK